MCAVLFGIALCVLLSSEFYQQYVYVGRRDARNARCLADGCGMDASQFLTGFDGQGLQLRIVEVIGDGDVFQTMQFIRDEFFAFNVSPVLDLYFSFFDRVGRNLLRRQECFEIRQNLAQRLRIKMSLSFRP